MYIVDPDFLRDPSGCTAVAALITEDDRIFVVRQGVSYGRFVAATDLSPPIPLVTFFRWVGLGFFH